MLVDPELVAEIRRLERATGRNDIFSGFVRKLEADIQAFAGTFSGHVARGEAAAAVRAAHTLKGSCRQLGAMDLGFWEPDSVLAGLAFVPFGVVALFTAGWISEGMAAISRGLIRATVR